MTRTVRRLLIPAVVAAALLVPAPAALAQPNDRSAVSTFPLTCDGQLVTLTVGGGPWSAAHVAVSGETFVPSATRVVIWDAATGEVVFQQDDYKGAPKRTTSACTETFEMDGLLGSFVVEGRMH